MFDSIRFYTNKHQDTMTTAASTNYWNSTASATYGKVRHTPGVKLSHEQRNQKSDQHKFGLCCDCDTGLDDRADFIIGKNTTRLLCNGCSAYYAEACTALRVRRFLAKIDDTNVCDHPDSEPEKGDH